MTTELAKPPTGIKSLLTGDKFKEQLSLALPSHLQPDRWIRIALNALTRTPKLMDCSEASLFRCLLDLSSLGLEPDGRNAHLIPYGKECTLIIDYKGLIALAKRAGDVKSWSAELVCEKDAFSWKDGIVEHSIDWRDIEGRGAVQCVYSRVTMDDGTLDFEVMTLAECEAIRKRSKAGNSGPWQSDFNEMCKKTVIRRHSKRLTLSPEFRDALEKDGDTLGEIRKERIITARVAPLDPFSRPEALPMPPSADLDDAPEAQWGEEESK